MNVQTRARLTARILNEPVRSRPKVMPALRANDPRLDKVLSNVGDLTFRRRIVTILEYLAVTEEDVVLDAGCGEGFYVMLLTQLTKAKVYGLDGNKKLIDRAQKWVGDTPQAVLQVGDVGQLPYPDKTFSKIICSEVLEHLPDPPQTLHEIRRVLKDDGVLAVTVPNHHYPALFDPLNWVRESLGLGHFSANNEWLGGLWANHIRLYTPKLLEQHITEGGFVVSDMRAMSRYCIPFQQLILFGGRQFFTKLPVSESVRVGMEKFEWEQAAAKTSWHPAQVILRTGLGLLRAVDSFNNQPLPLNGPAVHLATKLTKA